MDRSDARRLLAVLRDDFAEARAAAVTAQNRVMAIQKMLNGLVELYPDVGDPEAPDSDTTEARPRGVEAIKQVFMENEGKWFTISEMHRALAERGWLPDSEDPMSAIRTSLARAEKIPGVRKDRGKTSGAVVYSYRPFELREGAEASEVSASPAPTTKIVELLEGLETAVAATKTARREEDRASA